jgi:hypothetical protein
VVSRGPLTIVVLLAMGIIALTLIGQGWLVPLSFFSPISTVVSVISVVLALWDVWLWRFGVLHPWPVRRPDLRGTWRGELTRAGAEPIILFLVVEQTFWSIHLRTFTAESRSTSVVANLSEVDGQFLLASLYRNAPGLLIQERSRPHRGATWLWVHGPPPDSLGGDYWTDRDTKGELGFKRISRRRASDFTRAMALAVAAPPAQASPSNLRSMPRDTPSRRAASD